VATQARGALEVETRGHWRWDSGGGETETLDMKLDLVGECFVSSWCPVRRGE
jgi:hypothetical protein